MSFSVPAPEQEEAPHVCNVTSCAESYELSLLQDGDIHHKKFEAVLPGICHLLLWLPGGPAPQPVRMRWTVLSAVHKLFFLNT